MGWQLRFSVIFIHVFFRVGSYVVGVSPTFQVGKMGVGRDEQNCIFWVNMSSYLYSTVHMSRPTDRQTDRPTDQLTDRPTDWQIDRLTDIVTHRAAIAAKNCITNKYKIWLKLNCSAIYLFNVPDFCGIIFIFPMFWKL